MSGETTRFQSRYQLLLGRRVVGEYAEALSEGIAVASTRCCYGDDLEGRDRGAARSLAGSCARGPLRADTSLLIKLLDAGQRLPVHAHPAGSFAARHLGRAHGKGEAWFILDGGEVYLGSQAGCEWQGFELDGERDRTSWAGSRSSTASGRIPGP